jgi:hypothetical protein
MLPTVAPEEMEKFSVFAALGEPMACEPKFTLGGVPVKLTCARAAEGSSRPARRTINRAKRRRRDWSLLESNVTEGIIMEPRWVEHGWR